MLEAIVPTAGCPGLNPASGSPYLHVIPPLCLPIFCLSLQCAVHKRHKTPKNILKIYLKKLVLFYCWIYHPAYCVFLVYLLLWSGQSPGHLTGVKTGSCIVLHRPCQMCPPSQCPGFPNLNIFKMISLILLLDMIAIHRESSFFCRYILC